MLTYKCSAFVTVSNVLEFGIVGCNESVYELVTDNNCTCDNIHALEKSIKKSKKGHQRRHENQREAKQIPDPVMIEQFPSDKVNLSDSLNKYLQAIYNLTRSISATRPTSRTDVVSPPLITPYLW